MIEIKIINEYTLPEKVKFIKILNEFLLPKKYVEETRRLKTMAYTAEFGTLSDQVQLSITQIQLQSNTFSLTIPAYQSQVDDLKKVSGVNGYNDITFASIYFVYEFTDGTVEKIKLVDIENIQVYFKRYSSTSYAEITGAAKNYSADDSRVIKDVVSMNSNSDGNFVFQTLPAEFVAPSQGDFKRFFQFEGVWYECVEARMYITATTSRVYLTGALK
jgi:hypothetical protein